MKKQRLRVMRAEFEVLVVLKDDCFTKRGQLRKAVQNGIAKLLQFEAHKFIDSKTPQEIIENSTIEYEDVEVEEERIISERGLSRRSRR